jgi:hypothetical protein
MATFLTLPQELRDKILTLAIEAPLSLLQPPAPSEDHQSSIDNFTSFYGRINTIPTLLVNKQLHRETKAAIDRLPNKHSYELDILLVNEVELWPTWLSVPALTSQIEKVRATIRYIDIINRSDHGWRGFRRRYGATPMITWSSHDLLTRSILCIHRDWQTQLADKSLKDNVSIKLLELDVRSPDVPPGLIGRDVHYMTLEFLREKNGVDYVLNPEFLVDFIEFHLWKLLEYHMACHGRFLYERIGTIKIYLDGELRKELDIGYLLATMKLQSFAESFERPKPRSGHHEKLFWEWMKLQSLADSFEHPKAHPREHKELFRKWRKNAYNSREQFGLPIVPLQEED